MREGRLKAAVILKELKPDVIFSKGGFVALPVVRAAKRLKIPVVAHESDFTPGLANRLTARHCVTVCASFESAAKKFGKRGVFTGAPIRPELYTVQFGSEGTGHKAQGTGGGQEKFPSQREGWQP